MRITTDCEGGTLVNTNFNHSRLGIGKIFNSLNDLINVFTMNKFPLFEPLHHIINKLLRHFITQSNTIILVIDNDSINVQILKSRRWIRNFNSLLKLDLT